MLRKIGYGVVVWAVPYVTALALMDLMTTDRVAFQTVMIVEGALVGSLLTWQYFRTVTAHPLREGVVLATVWLLISWTFDFVALVPFAGMSAWRYFVEIGFRYLGMFALPVTVGAVLGSRIDRRVELRTAA